MLGLGETFEEMLAHVLHDDRLGQVAAQQLLGSQREQHLPTMPGRANTRHTVEGMAGDVVRPGYFGRPAVQTHSYAQRLGGLPGSFGQAALNIQGGLQGLQGQRKGGLESVSNDFENSSPVFGHGCVEDGVVPLGGFLHGRRLTFPQRGAAHHIGEQKGDRSGRQGRVGI